MSWSNDAFKHLTPAQQQAHSKCQVCGEWFWNRIVTRHRKACAKRRNKAWRLGRVPGLKPGGVQ